MARIRDCLYEDSTRHGTLRYRFRKDRDAPRITLPGKPGDAEFEDAYKRLMAGQDIRKSKTDRPSSKYAPGIIAVFAALVRVTKDHDLAEFGSLLAGKVLMDEWTADEAGVRYFDQDSFTKDRFLFFWRNDEGTWAGDIKTGPDETDAEITRRLSDSYSGPPVFTVVNFGAILRHTLLAVLKVQIQMAQEGEAQE